MSDAKRAQAGRIGGRARRAAMTPAEATALGLAASDARWGAHRAERIAQGLPPTSTKPETVLDPAVVAYWRGVNAEEDPARDAAFTPMQRRRAAIARARAEAAKATASHEAEWRVPVARIDGDV